MLTSRVELGTGNVRRIPSPEICIYCNAKSVKLTDEHVIQYALAGNTLILEKSCCEVCQKVIQPYEQEVLKKQLGIFRTQVSAPSRTKKKYRQKDVKLHFVEVDDSGRLIRDLGNRSVSIDQAPLALNLWSSPPPRLLRKETQKIDEIGKPWSFFEKDIAVQLCQKIAKEEGARHVAMRLGDVNRMHYLRFLAKTAHAYAAAEIGLKAFTPFLPDLILNKTHDVAKFIGNSFLDSPFDSDQSDTFQISIGGSSDGAQAGYLVARIQLYPQLQSPAHLVVIGKIIEDIEKRFQ